MVSVRLQWFSVAKKFMHLVGGLAMVVLRRDLI